MRCLRCSHPTTRVLESRLSHDGKSIRRRRLCHQCGDRYTTYEREESLVFHVRKKSGQTEPYEREKARRSIQIACQKRAVKLDEIEFLLGKIEAQIQGTGEKVVSSRQLGDLIMGALNRLDPVAYVRFASVYKEFQTPGEFQSILKSLGPRSRPS